MSFQAYLDNIETKTGKTPNDLIALAQEKGFDAPEVKAGTIVDWLKEDFDIGRGHAMAPCARDQEGSEDQQQARREQGLPSRRVGHTETRWHRGARRRRVLSRGSIGDLAAPVCVPEV
jgi:hypothetical protein